MTVGVRLSDGEEIPARRAVVSACDPRVTLDRLVPPDTLPDAMVRRVRRLPANADGTGDLKVDVAVSVVDSATVRAIVRDTCEIRT